MAAVGNSIANRPLINFGASASYAAMRSKVLTNSNNPYLFFGDRRLSFEDPAFTESLNSDQIERLMRHVRLGLDQGDIVIFDANTITDQATCTEPYQAPKGFSWVVINGEVIVQDGAIVDSTFPGQIIIGGG